MDPLYLPKSLTINGRDIKINTDFRDCIAILRLLEDPVLSNLEKVQIMIGILFNEELDFSEYDEALAQAILFLDGGPGTDNSRHGPSYGKLYSWEQDLIYILSGVDKVLGFSCRTKNYMHWWEFLTAFMEMGECTFSTLVHQRKLKKQGNQSKAEKEWWAENRDIAELDKKALLTSEERSALDKFNKLLGE
ncbi:hypothetical protein Ami103574_00065 [Aminipila butyrica]|uniref:Bacteriophage Gp15 protein n=1 Tax=Aminipila butyrica TaxID=433296 RepID=A0A858BRY3_9FIRM|nr:Gp15 family bacteriophage protein [Aminipila butyrica]QIB67808.1 hypothetical protein Ami103574_00065 [Aminipila butyrica]